MQLGGFHRVSKVYKVINCVTSRGMKSTNFGSNLGMNNLHVVDNEGRPQKLWTEDAYNKDFPSLAASIHLASKSKGTPRQDSGDCPEQKSEKEGENNGQFQHEPSASSDPEVDLSLPSRFGKQQIHSASDNHKLHLKHPKYVEKNRSSVVSTKNDKNAPFRCEPSASINREMYSSLPTSFGRKHVPSASRSHKIHRNHQEYVGARKSPGVPATSDNKDEPFDICISETVNRNDQKSNGNGQLPEEDGQHKNNMEMESDSELLVKEESRVLGPGMVLLKSYIPLHEQVEIVKRCRDLGCSPGGFYRPGYKDGAKLRLYMMCLGLDWDPQTKRYGKIRLHDDAAPADMPNEFTSLVSRILDDSHTLIKREVKITNVEDILPRMSPDVCIVNYYTINGRLGLHQDRDESRRSLDKGLPVVSLSIGDSAEFLYGDTRDVDKAESVILESGDVLIFGGESRHIFHGVTTIYRGTAPQALLESSKLRPGRLNLTFRKY